MKRYRTLAKLGVAAFGLVAWLAAAGADEAPASAAKAPPPSDETVSLQGFAEQNPRCLEWGDDCSICERDEKYAPHCSTPGIACQPAPIACRGQTAK
jgi:hypothetical protein